MRHKVENERLKALLKKQKIQSINKDANKPSSKRPEWNKSGAGNDGKEKKNGKGRGKKPRKGAGNRPKNLKPDRKAKATVDHCTLCGKDLSDEKPLETSNGRIIEGIPDVVEKPEVIKVVQEKKYCPDCKEVITAKSELALPKADIGLNSTILICYLWVALCLPFTKIKDYLKAFFGKDISTSGLSKHVIRVSRIMEDVYNEIGSVDKGDRKEKAADMMGQFIKKHKDKFQKVHIMLLSWTDIVLHKLDEAGNSISGVGK